LIDRSALGSLPAKERLELAERESKNPSALPPFLVRQESLSEEVNSKI
jgi:hypothetical protein